MNNQQILENAPEGATHVSNNGVYYRYDSDFIPAIYWVRGEEWLENNKITHLCRSLADITEIIALREHNAEIKKELESALYFNIDVIRCLSKMAWEHNHDEIPAYMNLAKKCVEVIESKLFEALKEQGE